MQTLSTRELERYRANAADVMSITVIFECVSAGIEPRRMAPAMLASVPKYRVYGRSAAWQRNFLFMDSNYNPTGILTYKDPAAMIEAFPQPLIHYENDGAILLEDCGFEFDQAFLSTIVFPPEWKKIGSFNHLTVAPLVYRDGAFVRTHNPLCGLIDDDRLLLATYAALLRLELSFKLLFAQVFPTYDNVQWKNCMFRFTATRDEPPHLDYFNNGNPFAVEFRQPRLKIFLNVDTEARIWHVGPTLRDLLKYSREYLAPALPSDLNVLCALIFRSGALDHCPLVKVAIPPRGAIFANGATVVHQVVYGNRMVSLEGTMPSTSLFSSAGSEWDNLKLWLREAGYSCVDA